MTYKSILPQETPIPELHQYLLGAVSPRPICFASTKNAKGEVNLAPFSFFNVFSANPPILVFSPARSGRDGTQKHTFLNVLEVPEVVVNIVTFDMVQKMNVAAAPWEEGVSEFEKAGFTGIASDLVSPLRVAESPIQMECKVIETKSLGENGGAGNLIIAEVLKIHVQDKYLNAEGKIMPERIGQVGRMGGSWYCKTGPENMFQLAQPMQKTIGYDAIPDSLKNATWLTANDLGKLACMAELPNKEVQDSVKSELTTNSTETLSKNYLYNEEWSKLFALYTI